MNNPFFNSTAWVVALMLFFQPFIANGEEKNFDFRSSDVILTHKVAMGVAGYRDLNAQAAGIGIDYPVLLQRALDKEKAAIFLLLWMAGNAPLDGAGTEGYYYSMVKAANEIGDQLMSEASQRLDRESKIALLEAFVFEYMDADEERDPAIQQIKKEFPLLLAVLIKH